MHHKFIKRSNKRQGRRQKMKQARNALKGKNITWISNILNRASYGAGLSKGDFGKTED